MELDHLGRYVSGLFSKRLRDNTMACYKPISAYHGPHGVTFNRKDSFGTSIQLPCRRCLGCRLKHAKDWQIRCYHESLVHGVNNTFLTLTYDDHHLPPHRSLDKQNPSHWQKFIRAVRDKTKEKIRYIMCGEYGSKCEKHQNYDCDECGPTQRPHYHAILFGFWFADSYQHTTRNGNKYYRSDTLERIWHHGTSETARASFDTMGYVARYILKKQTGPTVESAYGIPDLSTGEITSLKKSPYTAMSLKPGIGKKWYEENKMDLFPHDYAVLPNGVQHPVPDYYRNLLKKEDPLLFEQLRLTRLEKLKASAINNTPERLAVREQIQTEKAERLIRTL